MTSPQRLFLVCGDQLDRDAIHNSDFDPGKDMLWMCEARSEAIHVWSHKQRIVLFLAAMRHFADFCRERDWPIHYTALDADDNAGSLPENLAQALVALEPEKVVLWRPGAWRLWKALLEVCEQADVPVETREESHFLCSIQEFAEHAKGRKQLRMEYFYRMMRKRYDVLMDGKKPVGGGWNYDSENRGSFGKDGPPAQPPPISFAPDETTEVVIELVKKEFSDHPGTLDTFDWPVTPGQGRQALDDFLEYRIQNFGNYQDAMWTDEPFLFHARISAALNLKLLNPRDVLDATTEAWRERDLPLAAVEGFLRQVLGWREYVRGIYWLHMPDYLTYNELEASEALPDFYWSGETDMTCLAQSVGQTLKYAYAHHIQRLMVTGLYAMLLGVRPQEVHAWYLAIYIDAVEWVELPNTLGMSQFGDGGMMASKPYAATGKYIKRMSNYCDSCRFDPAKATGEEACPFTTLYWDFLIRHEERFERHPRMALQVRNLKRKADDERKAIQERAAWVRAHPAASDSQV